MAGRLIYVLESVWCRNIQLCAVYYDVTVSLWDFSFPFKPSNKCTLP